MALVKCKECGKDVSESAKKCPHCGVDLIEKKEVNKRKCPDCGNDVDKDDKVCKNCGCPLVEEKSDALSDVGKTITENLDKITGASSKSYVTIKDLFKNSLDKHTQEDMDDVFIVGGKNTTPDIKEINPKNTTAWVYLRILAFFAIALVAMYLGYNNFKNDNFLPGLIILGAFAVPVTVLIFFFEIDLFKKIPFHRILAYFILGGALSLIVTILLNTIFVVEKLDVAGAIITGFVEEVAKAIIVIYFLSKEKKANYILDGLLIGAAVGAGFAAFETAGYILRFGIAGGNEQMFNVMILRAILAPGGHVAWAAIEGAGLMFVKGYINKLENKHYTDTTFLTICLIPIALHSIWDMPFGGEGLSMYLKYGILIIGAWAVVVYFINLGLKQVDDVKEYYSKKNDKSNESSDESKKIVRKIKIIKKIDKDGNVKEERKVIEE